MSRRIVFVFLTIGLLAACSSQQDTSTEIVLDVTGTATIETLTLTVDGTATEEKPVMLPWSRTLTFTGGEHTWKLELRYGGGEVRATGTAGGKLFTQTSGSSSPGSTSSARLSGSINP